MRETFPFGRGSYPQKLEDKLNSFGTIPADALKGGGAAAERADMLRILGPEGSFHAYLLAAVAIGFLLTAKCAVQTVLLRYRTPKWVEILTLLAAVALAFILTLDAAVNVAQSSLITLGLGVIFCAAHAGVALLKRSPRIFAARGPLVLTIVLTLAATCWSSHRYSAGMRQLESETLVAAAGIREPIAGLVAVTDQGREVKLYRWVSDEDASSSLDPQSNCHGWVFAGGQHLLWQDDVQRILEDNGYEVCSSPQPGDVIVYRNPQGEIVHTGVVKKSLLSQQPLVESKWGLFGRFVHHPKEQPYGNNFSYYRSARAGHSLAIVPARPMAIARLQTPQAARAE